MHISGRFVPEYEINVSSATHTQQLHNLNLSQKHNFCIECQLLYLTQMFNEIKGDIF